VRVSELSHVPSENVLKQLRRLELGQAKVLENLSLEPGKGAGQTRLAVALAGGSPIGYALRRDLELMVVVAASWRGKGIEGALETLLEPSQLEVILPSGTASWTVLAPDAAGCDPVTGTCEVPQNEGAVSSPFVVLGAREDSPGRLTTENLNTEKT